MGVDIGSEEYRRSTRSHTTTRAARVYVSIPRLARHARTKNDIAPPCSNSTSIDSWFDRDQVCGPTITCTHARALSEHYDPANTRLECRPLSWLNKSTSARRRVVVTPRTLKDVRERVCANYSTNAEKRVCFFTCFCFLIWTKMLSQGSHRCRQSR